MNLSESGRFPGGGQADDDCRRLFPRRRNFSAVFFLRIGILLRMLLSMYLQKRERERERERERVRG
jgi:hypothetical protein